MTFSSFSLQDEKNTALVPSLKKMASQQLVIQLGTLEEVEKYIQTYPAESLYDEVQVLIDQCKLFLQSVAYGDLQKAEAILKDHMEFLSFFLKSKAVVVTYAKGFLNSVRVEGTALRIAAGAGDVGRKHCDIYLMKGPFPIARTCRNKLFLYHDHRDPDSFLYKLKNGKICKIKKNDLGQLRFDALKQAFDDPDLLRHSLNLHPWVLNEIQKNACQDILNITASEGHTNPLMESEIGMVEMLETYLKKLPEGEQEITRQLREQFPKGWKREEEKKHKKDLIELFKVVHVIFNALTNEECDKAIYRFRCYLEPKDIIRTGKHWNMMLLSVALEIGANSFRRYESFLQFRKKGHKNPQQVFTARGELFFKKVVAPIQRLASAYYAMAQIQGLCHAFLGKEFYRCLRFFLSEDRYFPLCTSPLQGLGADSWANCWTGRRSSVMHRFFNRRSRESLDLKLLQQYVKAREQDWESVALQL